ncbi:hypothetical protein NJLHNGOC_11490 [Novacetimonas cocois]|nr:hypothetical protein CFR71_12070 [Novacetimonas pomaceti]RBM05893.1 hypothetical protein NJLHNGOC_11490 [Novacetimonas cocois]
MKCMAISTLGFFFSGGISNAYATPASPVSIVMFVPDHAGQPSRADVHMSGDTKACAYARPIMEQAQMR